MAKTKKRRPYFKNDLLSKQKVMKNLQSKATQALIEEQSRRNTERALWIAGVALNEEFGFGGQRVTRFLLKLAEISQEYDNLKNEVDSVYADEKLRLKIEAITKTEIPNLYSSEVQ